ncbi:MAG: type III PLP-dependent enzyme [bacterium]|nr:type III PLP-dependent enzyme [bacterium]
MTEVPLDSILNDPSTSTPSLTLDFETISATYDRFIDLFPGGMVYYAMKANANPQIVQLVVNRGGGLEIASAAELRRALDAGATGDQIICSNPIKHPAFIRQMQEADVYAMVVDSTFEVEKVAQVAPGSRVYVRLAVDNTGSVLPLAGKFGVDGEQALMLLDLARELGLQPIGLSFHVGSQCLTPFNWVNAIRACGSVWERAEERGHNLYFLDIGGGFPVGHYHDVTIPTLETISEGVMAAVRDFIPDCPNLMLVLEPGRGLVGEAGHLLATVVGKAQRGESTWLYMDVGVFNGLMETFEGFPPVVRLLSDDADARPVTRYTLAGPSCDSCDVVARDILLPEIHINDRLVFYDTGAYTNEYAAAFNGFPVPEVITLNEDAIEQPFVPVWSLARTS